MGQPLYRVLGGAVRDFLPVYATHPDSHALAREGFVGAKTPMAYGPADGKEGLRKNVARVAEMREAVGPDIDIMVDCWMSWSVDYTLAFAREAASLGVRWIEEPLPPDDYDGYAELRRRIRGPLIATGEHEYTRWGFKTLLTKGCADVLQPDVAWGGGVSEFRRIAAMASAYDIPVIPHNGLLQPWATPRNDDHAQRTAGRVHRLRSQRRDAAAPADEGGIEARTGSGSSYGSARSGH